jgi:hypothetical protein
VGNDDDHDGREDHDGRDDCSGRIRCQNRLEKCHIWGIQKTHLLMPWQICFFFTMDEKDFEWEMSLTASKAGRQRISKKLKRFWTKKISLRSSRQQNSEYRSCPCVG